MSTTIIIILILIIIILALVIGMYFYFRKRVRDFSMKVFNTPNIMDGFKKQEIEYAETPKSLSSLDSVVKPKILKDFPNLDFNEMTKIAENSIMSYYNTISKKKLDEDYYMSDHLIKMLNEEIYSRENSDVTYDNIKIHRTVINDYNNKNGSCIITFQSAVEYNKKKNNKSVKTQVRINVDMIYIYDDTKVKGAYGVSLNCKNCGAPIKMLGIKSCPYCGTGVVDYMTKTWKVNNIYEK